MTGLRGAILVATCLLAFAAPAPAKPPAAKTAAVRPAPATAVPCAALDRILHAAVGADGLVNYDEVCGAQLPALTAALAQLAAIDPAALPPRERNAFWINLYNATLLRAVCGHLREGWTPAANGYAVFDEPLVRSLGALFSLNHLEHDVLRPAARDPRVHVALVCGARSCPVLLPRAYRGGDLDSLLDANMLRFLRDPARNRVDAAARTLELSRLFDWYAADFGGAGAVPGYVGRVLGRDFTGWKVTFKDYDWTLNRAGSR